MLSGAGLLDLAMPYRDGFEIMGELLAASAGAPVPILVITADTGISGRRKALEAGVDLEVPEAEGFKTLVADQKAGRVSQATIDRAVARVLRAKLLLGLFEHPFVDANLENERPADRALARQAADEAIVLLKNSGNL